jgi:uncharacterized protein (TIGR03083 family)
VRDVAELHALACHNLTPVVGNIDTTGRWTNQSPCPEWDARGVLEHVIGFHGVLLLRPAGAKPERPKGNPVLRWRVSEAAILQVIGDEDDPVADIDRLLPALTVDVLVHTWDLARAARLPLDLDPDLCRYALETVEPNLGRLQDSGMFAPARSLSGTTDPESRLIALLGRDPGWVPPGHPTTS